MSAEHLLLGHLVTMSWHWWEEMGQLSQASQDLITSQGTHLWCPHLGGLVRTQAVQSMDLQDWLTSSVGVDSHLLGFLFSFHYFSPWAGSAFLPLIPWGGNTHYGFHGFLLFWSLFLSRGLPYTLHSPQPTNSNELHFHVHLVWNIINFTSVLSLGPMWYPNTCGLLLERVALLSHLLPQMCSLIPWCSEDMIGVTAIIWVCELWFTKEESVNNFLGECLLLRSALTETDWILQAFPGFLCHSCHPESAASCSICHRQASLEADPGLFLPLSVGLEASPPTTALFPPQLELLMSGCWPPAPARLCLMLLPTRFQPCSRTAEGSALTDLWVSLSSFDLWPLHHLELAPGIKLPLKSREFLFSWLPH